MFAANSYKEACLYVQKCKSITPAESLLLTETLKSITSAIMAPAFQRVARYKSNRPKKQSSRAKKVLGSENEVTAPEVKVETEEEKAFWTVFGDIVGFVLQQTNQKYVSADTVAPAFVVLGDWIPGVTEKKWRGLKGEMDRRFFENGKVVAAIYHAGHRFLKGNEMEAKRIAG